MAAQSVSSAGTVSAQADRFDRITRSSGAASGSYDVRSKAISASDRELKYRPSPGAPSTISVR